MNVKTALIEVSNSCNLNCRHCYIDFANDVDSVIDLKEFEKILDNLANYGFLKIVLTGFEPFCNNNIYKFIKLARKKRFIVQVKTNGLLVDDEVAHNLYELGVYKVETSLYSYEKDYHDFITRADGSFEKTVNAIKYLKSYKIKVTVNTPLTSPLISLGKMYSFINNELNVSLLLDPLILHILDKKRDANDLLLSEKEMISFLQFMDEHSDLLKGELKFERFQIENCICGIATDRSVYIDYKGKYHYCARMPEKESAATLDFEEKFNEGQKLRKNITNFRKCKKCDLLEFCNPCPAIALQENNDIYSCASAQKKFAKAKKKYYQLNIDKKHLVNNE